ncbi:MAG TPA: type II secretion system protein [Candidatus Sumerlaeota bacterium]|nr:type II secretion system protein [Candidatus Sumerlaeota bacterium]
MNGSLRQSGGRRGMTLVELTVASGALVVVLGLALGIMLESRGATDEITRRQQAIQYSQQVIEQVTGLLRSAVPPAELTGIRERGVIRPEFRADQLSVPTYEHPLGSYLCMATVSNAAGGEAGESVTRIVRTLDPVMETVAGEVARKDSGRLGLAPLEGMSAAIEFGYAAPRRPGEAVEYQPRWEGEGFPPLVRVRVTVQPRDPKASPIALQTAVAPGMRPPAPAATDTPTTVPAALTGPIAGETDGQDVLPEEEQAP